MPAQKDQGRDRFPLRFGEEPRPCPQNVFRLARGEAPRAFRALVVAAQQRSHVGQAVDNVLGLHQQAHRFVKALRAIQHRG